MINISSRTAKFVTEVEDLISSGLDVMDAIVHYCELNNIEIETAASIIKSNQRIKSRLQFEAERLNYLPKTSKLQF